MLQQRFAPCRDTTGTLTDVHIFQLKSSYAANDVVNQLFRRLTHPSLLLAQESWAGLLPFCHSIPVGAISKLTLCFRFLDPQAQR